MSTQIERDKTTTRGIAAPSRALTTCNRITMYSHVKTGEVPTLRIGRRIRVPSAFVLRQLRIEAAA